MKKILLLALLFSFLIKSQAQHNIGGGGTLTGKNGVKVLNGVISNDTAALPTVSAASYGAIGDGVTDNYAALSAMMVATAGMNYTMILPHGTYLISQPLAMRLINATFRGQDSSTKIICMTSGSVFKFVGDFINSHIQYLELYSGYINATQDFGNGPIYSIGFHNWHSSVDYVTCKAPYANVTGINFIVQTGSSGGSNIDLHLTHFTVDSCGQSGVSVVGRNYSLHGKDSCADIFLEYFYIGHLGLSGTNGTGVTQDGNGKRGKMLHGVFNTCYDICVENTGYDSWEYGWIRMMNSSPGNPLYGFSFDPLVGRPLVKHCWVHDVSSDSLPNTAGFFMRCTDLTVERSTFLTNGGSLPAAIFRNCSNYTTRWNHYGSNYQIGVEVQDRWDTAGVNGIHSHETVDNSNAASNTALIEWTGPNIRNDAWDNLTTKKATGGSYTLNTDSANNNYVSSMSLSTDTTALASMITTVTMTDANYIFTQDQDNILSTLYVVNGSLSTTRTLTFNNVNHNNFSIFNNTNQSLTVTYGATASTVLLPTGQTMLFFNDGTTLRGFGGGSGGGAGVSSYNTRTGAVTPSSGDYTIAQISGQGAGIATFLGTPSSANLAAAVTGETGTGALVFGTSPTLVTPALGTPSAIVLTNGTALPVSTGISGMASGIAAFLATPNSGNLGTAVIDETGSGALVFAISPTFTTPNLGTPSAITLTNGTALPVSTGISGMGAGIASWLATPNSANLATALTDETGTAGSVVFSVGPTLTGSVVLPLTTTLASNPSSGNNSTQVATTNMVQLALAGSVASGKVKPVVASVSGPITSITADSLVYSKAGNGLSCSGHFTCTPPASGSCTASVTLPNPSGLVGGHACFGVASWSNGTSNGVSTSVIGAGNGAVTVAQINWVSGGASATEVYFVLVYFQQ